MEGAGADVHLRSHAVLACTIPQGGRKQVASAGHLRHLLRPAGSRGVTSWTLLSVVDGELVVITIDDEHRQQLCRLRLAGIAADEMARARVLVEAFASLVDAL